MANRHFLIIVRCDRKLFVRHPGDPTLTYCSHALAFVSPTFMLIFRFGKIYGEDADQRPAANDQNPEYS